MKTTGWTLIALVLAMAIEVPAQVDTAWVRTYPGYHPYAGGAVDMAVTAQGVVYVLGTTWTVGGYANIATLKYSSAGELLWARIYDSGSQSLDYPVALEVDTEEKVYVAANTIFPGGSLYRLLKYDSSGTMCWEMQYSTSCASNTGDRVNNLVIDDQGGIYLTGRAYCVYEFCRTAKYEADGSVAWAHNYAPSAPDIREGLGIARDEDGTITVAARYWANHRDSVALLSYGPNGELTEVSTVPFLWPSFDVLLTPDRDHSTVIAGVDHRYASRICRLSRDGAVQYSRDYTSVGLTGEFTGLKLDANGNIVVASSGGALISAKLRPDGDTLWVRRVDGPLPGIGAARCNAIDHFGFVYTGGYLTFLGDWLWDDEDLIVAAYDAVGHLRWTYQWGTKANDERATVVAVGSEFEVYVAGSKDGDITLMKLLQDYPIEAVALDLFPGACPNTISTSVNDVRFRGIRPGSAAAESPTVPVAILGSKSFDVSRVDPTTIRIEGLASLAHRLMDVSRPVEPESECECTTEGADGYLDLVLYLDRDQLIGALEPITGDEVRTLALTGKTKTGVPLSGSDCVTITDGPIRISPMASAGERTGTGFAAYPNPFNAATMISFSLSIDSDVRLDVYDVLGRRVATLVDQFMPAGEHDVSWDAARWASGVYFARLMTNDGAMTRKMVLVR